jgi:hypothetical protein
MLLIGILPRGVNGRHRDVRSSGERVSIEEMIARFTINGAYENFLEKGTGSLWAGTDPSVDSAGFGCEDFPLFPLRSSLFPHLCPRADSRPPPLAEDAVHLQWTSLVPKGDGTLVPILRIGTANPGSPKGSDPPKAEKLTLLAERGSRSRDSFKK